MKEKLRVLFQTWDQNLWQAVQKERAEGEVLPRENYQLKIVGQMALLLADLPFPVAATMDIDILHRLPFALIKDLQRILLAEAGMILEEDQALIWMPEDAQYHPLFSGHQVEVSFADSLDVIASKCKFQRLRDKKLIEEYFKFFPEAKFKVKEKGINISWVVGKK